MTATPPVHLRRAAIALLLSLLPASGWAAPPVAKRAPPSPKAAKPSAGKPYRAQSPNASASAERTSSRLTPFVGKEVGTIEVRGLKRIEKDAVLGKMGTKAGARLDASSLRADVQALYGMGYFDDLEVEASESGGKLALVVAVRERPVISQIEFEGNERLSDSDLKDVVKVKEWSILDVNRVKDDTALIQKHYEDKGFFLARVGYAFTVPDPKRPDEVKVTYKVSDFEKVRIKKVTFLNNKAFSDDKLRTLLLETQEGGFFSFMSNAGNFKEASFKQDLQRLTVWYLDHGYVKFRYENPVVTVSDDKKWLYISIYVDEGEQYSIGNLDFSGDLLFSKEELKSELVLQPGEKFSLSNRNQDIQKLTEKYQDLGYAFVNVVPRMDIRDEDKTVNIDYGFEKGNLCYFGEINVLGNGKTHDKVIRRELKIQEGELYSGSKLRRSREGVERLGFFAPGEVVFNSVTPKGRNDVVDIEITVKERPTGTITLGAGYGSVQQFFFQSQISEINLFGRGQSLNFSTTYSAQVDARTFSLGFTDPYSFNTKWNSGFDVYYLTFPIPARADSRRLGFDVRLGYPLGDYMTGFITYKNESLRLVNENDRLPESFFAPDRGVLSSVTLSLVRDKRNNRFEPSAGNYQSVSTEIAGLGGDKSFVKWVANNRFYHRLVGDLIFRNSFETGHIYPTGGKTLPFSEMFCLGGANNLKGYRNFALCPSISVAGVGQPVPLGGVFEAYSLFELEYPLIREAGIKGVIFFDAGNAWGELPNLGKPITVRSDAGFGIRWFSPIGPLRFEWGFPLAAGPGEDMQFIFNIGPPF